MDDSDEEELLARIAELERENARLRESATPAAEKVAAPTPGRARQRGRAIGSAVLVVVALLLTPLAVIAGLAKNTVTDTDAFVATFAPLADDPSVQATVTNGVVVVIEDAVDIPGLTSQVFDGLEGLDLPDSASVALLLLEGPAVQGVRSLIRQVVGEFVTSDAFSNVWRQALAVSHGQMVATMTDAPGSAVSISVDGALALNLGPIVAEVRSRLVDSGLELAANIPDVDRSIVIAQSDTIRQAKAGHALVVAVGTWLPWVAMLMLGAGVLVAVNRRATLLRAGVAMAVLMLLVLASISIGRAIAVGQLSSELVSRSTATILYDTAVDAILRASTAVCVLGMAVALAAFLVGPNRFARGARQTAASVGASVRATGLRHGLRTGRVGVALDRFHAISVGVIVAVAVAVIAFVRPLTVGVVLWTAVLSVLAVLVVEVLRTPEPVPETGQATPS